MKSNDEKEVLSNGLTFWQTLGLLILLLEIFFLLIIWGVFGVPG